MASRLNIENAIYIENDGQVGINVTEPSDQFEVNGTISSKISTGDAWLKQSTGGANKCIHYMNTSEGGASITKYGNDLRFENPHDTVRATLNSSGTFTVQGTANANALNVTGEFRCASNKVIFDTTAAYFEQNIIQLGAYPTLNKAMIDSGGSNIRLTPNGSYTGALEVNSSGNTILSGYLQSKGAYLNSNIAATDTRPALTTSSIGNYEIRGFGTNGTGGNEGFLRLSSGGGSNSANQAYIDICGYNTNSEMDDTITFGTSGAERFRVNTSGNIGIGTTLPETLLDIATPSITTPILTLRGGNGSIAYNDGAQIQFGYSGTTLYNHYIHTRHNSADSNNAIDFYLCDGTENNTLTSGSAHCMSLVSGKVGIGDSTPSYKLDVAGDINLTGDLRINGTIQSFDVSLPGDTRQGITKIYTSSTGDMFGIEQVSSAQSGISRPEIRLFTSEAGTAGIGFGKYTNATNFAHQMVIDQDGNVGIGTSTPAAKLEVNGQVFSNNRIVHYRDEKSNGSYGGQRPNTGYQPRTLNVRYGDTSFTTFTNSTITFTESGTYRISARCPGYRVSRHKCKIRKTDDANGNSADLFIGTSVFSNTYTPSFQNDTTLDSIFSITNGDVIQLQHYCQSSSGGHDYGVDASSGDIEVFSELWIERLN